MNEKPILFSASMVRAILEGSKTQTRRVVKVPLHCRSTGCELAPGELNEREKSSVDTLCPYGGPGTHLWVRETWCTKMEDGTFLYREDGHHDCWYAADGIDVIKDDGDGGTEYRKDGFVASPWKPSIHMPRWASRITLEITGVQVQRLQEITNTECFLEGIEVNEDTKAQPRFAFQLLWDSINAKRGFGWDKNPWVWAITFKIL